MKTISVSKNSICAAIAKATPNLKRGLFVDGITGKEFSEHCKVCAVGAIFQQIPKLKKAIEIEALEQLDIDYFIFENSLYDRIASKCFGTCLMEYGNQEDVQDELENQLDAKDYLSALSLYFESFLKKSDSKELKSASLQNFVLSFFPNTIKIKVNV